MRCHSVQLHLGVFAKLRSLSLSFPLKSSRSRDLEFRAKGGDENESEGEGDVVKLETVTYEEKTAP